MAQNFSKTITLAGTGWQNLLTLMIAAGYTGGALLSELNLAEDAGNAVRYLVGHSSSSTAPVSATDGLVLTSKNVRQENVDAPMAWIYAAGAFDIEVSSSSLY